MLRAENLPKKIWIEAIYTAIHLLNRSPTKTMWNQTPIEVQSGMKPLVKHLKDFGSICYAQIPNEKRYKLDEVKNVFFVDYSSQSKVYRMFDLNINKIIISRDVLFDENDVWNWDEKKIAQQVV